MTRRLSLTGQLLALQLVIISLVLVGVAAVTVAQSTARFRDTEGRRALAVAETVAANQQVRGGLSSVDASLTLLRSTAESARAVSGSTYVMITRPDRTVVASPDPDRLDRQLDLNGSPVLAGRSWVGTVQEPDGAAVVAHVPVLSEVPGDVGAVLGVVVVGREYPTVASSLAMAAPNLLTYLGLASVFGVLGSLLLARRVKRQTLGLEPGEIVGLVEHRDALLYGIKEGVLAVDLARRVTLVNGEAAKLLGLPPDAVGRTLEELPIPPWLRGALARGRGALDEVVPIGGRVLIFNSMSISNRGVPIGSVTTLRDRTELLELERELDVTRHATDTLRAQAHEFSNRLHTISGLIELGEYGEVVHYVQRLDAGVAAGIRAVTAHIADPAVAALLVAKQNQADERGVELALVRSSSLGRMDDAMSADIATVVGNLVDNAFDAIAPLPGERCVQVELVELADEVRITVRDNGPGIAPDCAEEVFRRGFTTKGPGAVRGIGLSLVQLICRRRGGSIRASNEQGAVFRAHLPWCSSDLPAADADVGVDAGAELTRDVELR